MTGVCFPDRMVKLIFYQANTGNPYCGQNDASDTGRTGGAYPEDHTCSDLGFRLFLICAISERV